jgi:hypothetical protein
VEPVVLPQVLQVLELQVSVDLEAPVVWDLVVPVVPVVS